MSSRSRAAQRRRNPASGLAKSANSPPRCVVWMTNCGAHRVFLRRTTQSEVMMAGIGQAAGLPDGSMAEILHSTCRDRLRQRRSPLPRILGHRGARLLAPENTLPGFRAAISEGADGVELDVRRTADQVLVCLHDAGLGRTTNGRGPVREHTLAEVRRLDAGGSLQGAELSASPVLAPQASAYFGPMAKLAAARAVDAGFQLLAWTVDDP